MTYLYLGDRHTDPSLKGKQCNAVRNEKGKCIRGRNGSMLIQWEDGKKSVVIGRLLRKIKSPDMLEHTRPCVIPGKIS